MKAGPWQVTDSGCGSMRVRVGGNPEHVADRVAFIEKTPRVRIRGMHFVKYLTPNSNDENWNQYDYLNWMEGSSKGDGPLDQDSKDWCDKVLVLLGYELA